MTQNALDSQIIAGHQASLERQAAIKADLLLKHRREIEGKSGVNETIVALNFRTVTCYREISEALEITKATAKTYGSGWLVSGVNPATGEKTEEGIQFKPDTPVPNRKGKARKYLSAAEYDATPLFLDTGTPNYWSDIIASQDPIFITEGAKKAGCLVSQGHACISLPGVWNGQQKGLNGKELKPSLSQFCNGRKVYLCFDADMLTNFKVMQALRCMAALFTEAGCSVLVMTWDSEFKGIDDLVVGKGIEALEEAISSAQPFDQFTSNQRTRVPKEDATPFQAAFYAVEDLLGDRLRFNLMTKVPELDGKAFPVDKVKTILCHDHQLRIINPKEELIEIVTSVAEQNSYHPVRDYLNAVYAEFKDDPLGLEGIASALAESYLGIDDLVANILLRKTLIGAIARAFNPGCKLDTSTVLVGGQGVGKSTFWKILASPEHFCDDFSDPADKDHKLKLHQSWIVEWGELHGLSRKEATQVKQFMSCAKDSIRAPYARANENMPRPSILVGTSNEDSFLSDATGNRRWWIIKCPKAIDIEKLQADRDLIWAAVMHCYLKGEAWWADADLERVLEAERKQYQVQDVYHDLIAEYLEGRDRVSVREILTTVLELGTPQLSNQVRGRVIRILKLEGFEQAPNPVFYSFPHGQKIKERVWDRVPSSYSSEKLTDGTGMEHMEHSQKSQCSNSVPTQTHMQHSFQALRTDGTLKSAKLCWENKIDDCFPGTKFSKNSVPSVPRCQNPYEQGNSLEQNLEQNLEQPVCQSSPLVPDEVSYEF
jgi:predicted P-loop ATPase